MEYNNKVIVGKYLDLAFADKDKENIFLFDGNTIVKYLENPDKTERKLFVIDAIKLGAQKSLLAKALGISRQTIDNYLNILKFSKNSSLKIRLIGTFFAQAALSYCSS